MEKDELDRKLNKIKEVLALMRKKGGAAQKESARLL